MKCEYLMVQVGHPINAQAVPQRSGVRRHSIAVSKTAAPRDIDIDIDVY